MADRWDDIFKALADTHRRRIVATLCRSPRAAGDLARLVDLAPNAVSFHLRILRSAGLLAVQRNGRTLEYRLQPRTLSSWLGQVDRLFPRESIAAVSTKPGRETTPSGHAEGDTVVHAADESSREVADSGSLPTELL